MSRPSRPLLYVDVSDGVTPGSLLTAATSDGAVGRWTMPHTVDLLNPTNAQLTDVVTAYNDLVWSLAQSRVLKTEPLIWFGVDGESGVRFVRNAGTSTEQIVNYVPYPLGSSQSYIPVSKVLTDLQGLFADDSGIRIMWFDNAFNIMITEGTLLFTDVSGTPKDSALRVLNRIFGGAFDRSSGTRSMTTRTSLQLNRVYSAIVTDNPNTTQLVILQGDPIIGPLSGKYPAIQSIPSIEIMNTTPYDITIDIRNITMISNARYYLSVSPRSAPSTIVYRETITDIEFTQVNKRVTIPSLQPVTEYMISVIAGDSYDVSTPKTIYATTSSNATPLPSSFAIYDTGTATYDSVSVRWDVPTGNTAGLQVELQCVGGLINKTETVSITLGGYTIVDLSAMNTDYTITARVTNGVTMRYADNGPITIRTLELALPDISIVPGSIDMTSFKVEWVTPDNTEFATDIHIAIDQTNTAPLITLSSKPYPIDSSPVLISGAAVDTEYTVSAYFITKHGQQSGATEITVRTFANIPAPDLAGVGGLDSVTFTWTPPPNLTGYYAIFIGYNDTFIPLAINEDGRLGTATLTGVTPGSTATYVARYVYRGQDGPISSPLTVSTLSPKFGPIPSGVGRGSTEVNAQLNTTNGGYGFWIPSDSSWIGKQFNTVRFPLVGGEGVLKSASTQGATLLILISDEKDDSQTNSITPYAQASISVLWAGNDQNIWPNAYEGSIVEVVNPSVSKTITITQNTRIYFIPLLEGQILTFRAFTNSTIPAITKLYNGSTGRVTDTTIGICCEFDLI